ncbi:MAG: lipase [Acidobacteriota bacterium]|nr:lipase family protein [Blastocatellia bacterium]MDW8413671.1 lipase [Acidobacteriota bacterium]
MASIYLLVFIVMTQDVLLEEAFTDPAHGWQKVERYRDALTGYPKEDYPPDGRGDVDRHRLRYFGEQRPHSSKFLLYYAPGWDKKTTTTPILLIHGTNDNADRAWANPNELGFGCGSLVCPSKGLMQALVEAGLRVFAINFAHKHGDNFAWSENIRAALELIRKHTHAAQVDIIGWSKGGFAARLYASDMKPAWGKGYQKDVRKLILLGCPNNGIDFAFRHGTTFSEFIYPGCGSSELKVNGPGPHIEVECGGKWISAAEYSIYKTAAGDCFPGQRQMLNKLDSIHPVEETTTDWKTTYYGGRGEHSLSLGIDVAMKDSLIAEMHRRGTPESVKVYILAGGAANIPFVFNEKSAPSDGLLFVSSATYRQGIRNLADVKVMERLNHLQLGWEETAVKQILSWLKE